MMNSEHNGTSLRNLESESEDEEQQVAIKKENVEGKPMVTEEEESFIETNVKLSSYDWTFLSSILPSGATM